MNKRVRQRYYSCSIFLIYKFSLRTSIDSEKSLVSESPPKSFSSSFWIFYFLDCSVFYIFSFFSLTDFRSRKIGRISLVSFVLLCISSFRLFFRVKISHKFFSLLYF